MMVYYVGSWGCGMIMWYIGFYEFYIIDIVCMFGCNCFLIFDSLVWVVFIYNFWGGLDEEVIGYVYNDIIFLNIMFNDWG